MIMKKNLNPIRNNVILQKRGVEQCDFVFGPAAVLSSGIHHII